MNGYLFSAGITRIQIAPTLRRDGEIINSVQSSDDCISAILYGGSPEQAQRRFEAYCLYTSKDEIPPQTQIKKIVAAQFVDRLLTESGSLPIDWRKITQRVNDILNTTAENDADPGYWVDVHQVVPRRNTIPNIEALQRNLPEDIRSGLNWASDKQFVFLVSVFTPRQSPAGLVDEMSDVSSDHQSMDAILDTGIATLPELRNKDAMALVEARNSVVAAWLWRNTAANTPLANSEIKIDPCCVFLPVE